jgi:hypothetical protein
MMQTWGESLEMIFWIISQVLTVIITGLLFYKYAKKKKEGTDARFDLGLAIFFLMSFVIYTNFLLCTFFISCNPLFSEFVVTFSMISLLVMVFTIEHVVLTKNRYIMTIIYLIDIVAVIIIGIVTGLGFLVPPMSVLNLVLILLLPLLYFYLAIKSTGEARIRSFLFGIGFLFALAGGTFRYEVLNLIAPSLVATNPELFHFGPILGICIGLGIVLYTYVKYFD